MKQAATPFEENNNNNSFQQRMNLPIRQRLQTAMYMVIYARNRQS